MTHARTVWNRLTLAVVMVGAALPLHALIPHGDWRAGSHGSTSLSAGRSDAESSRRIVCQYDALNCGTKTVYADGASAAFTYDAAGHQKSAKPEAEPQGDRDFEAVLPHGARSGIPRHSGNCNLLSASNAVASLAYAYDAMDRLTSSVTRVSGQAFAVRCGYDLGGLRTNVVYPDGRAVRYGYDADGRVVRVSDWAGRTWTFTRDAAGRLTALSCPNGVSGAWSYDANHAVASWSWSAGGAPFAGREITRDAAGIKTKENVTAGLFPNPQSPRRASNVFDAADRLVSATVATDTNTVAETYRYDACGARTNIVSGSETVFSATYDALGQVSVVGGQACGYDAAGNRVLAGGRVWVADQADPLKRPLVEADTNGVAVRYYIWGDGRLLGFVNAADGALTVAHCDELGSVVALTDASVAVTDQYCYGPYGEDWGRSGTNSVPFRWLGSHGVLAADALLSNSSLLNPNSSLYLTRHRLYSAALCRFLSPDPSGLGGGPNLYAYCMGNPLAYIDPLGLAISAASMNSGGLWYDTLGSLFSSEVAWSKDYINNSGMPWGLSGALNTGLDLINGFANIPSSIGHLGEGTWAFVGNPSWATSAGLFQDVSTVAGTLAGGLGAYQGATASITAGTTVPRVRHFTSPEGLAGIENDMAIWPGRGDTVGVHVEIQPFGPVRTGAEQTGAFGRGAYVEFDAPTTIQVPPPVGPRNTGVIPSTTSFSIQNLNPTFTTTPWWKFWVR